MKRKKAGDSKSRQNIIFNVSKQYIKKKRHIGILGRNYPLKLEMSSYQMFYK